MLIIVSTSVNNEMWVKLRLEEGILTIPDDGTPQDGVISPLLANIFLHYVLDEWFEQDVRPRLQGEAFVIRSELENIFAGEHSVSSMV